MGQTERRGRGHALRPCLVSLSCAPVPPLGLVAWNSLSWGGSSSGRDMDTSSAHYTLHTPTNHRNNLTLHKQSLSHLAFRLLACFRGFSDTIHTHQSSFSSLSLLLLPIVSPPFNPDFSARLYSSPPSLQRPQTGRRENEDSLKFCPPPL